MAEKAWYEKLLKANPNLTLDDIILHKIAEVTQLSEQLIADKVEKLKDGIKKGILPEEALATGEKKAREEAEKTHYRYDLDSLASRIERDCPSLLQDHEGTPIEGLTAKKLLEDVIRDPSVTLALVHDHEPLIDFFVKEFSIPKETMHAIVFKRWSPTHNHATRRRKTPEASAKAEPAPIVDVTPGGPTLVIRNASDHSHVLKVIRNNGEIHITILPDARVPDLDMDKGSWFTHSRKRVLMYTEGNPSFPEYNTEAVKVTCD